MNNPYKAPSSDVLKADEEGELILASRWLRFWGSVLDGIIIGVPTMGLAYYLGLYANIGHDGKLPLNDQIAGMLIGITGFMIINGFFIYKRGQTVGKMICGTKVVTLDGKQVPGNTYIFLRLLPIWFVTQIPVAGVILSFVDSVLIFRKGHNCLHDDIAKTRVVKI